MQALSLLVVTARLSGRLDVASECARRLTALLANVRQSDLWLGWAATFTAAVAGGAHGATPPFPPEDSPDPVAAMARLLIEAELVLAGRVGEALDQMERPAHPDLGVMTKLGGVFRAIALLLGGRPLEAEPWVEGAADAAEQLGSATVLRAAAALRAELAGDASLLPPPRPATGPHGSSCARSLVEALVLRGHIACGSGDTALRRSYTEMLGALGAPGLLVVAGSPPRAAVREAGRA